MATTLVPESTIARNPDIVFTDMNGEIVMMSIEQGEYYGLDKIATHIWEMLDSQLPINVLCVRLCERYEVDFQTCLNDTLSLLQTMADQRLIQLGN